MTEPLTTSPLPPPLTFALLRLRNVTRCDSWPQPLHRQTPSDLGCAVASEAGQLCEQLGRLRRHLQVTCPSRYRSTVAAEITRQLGREIADLVLYADLLAARLDLPLEHLLAARFNEVSEELGSSVKLPFKEEDVCSRSS